jgi:hypothetical protein
LALGQLKEGNSGDEAVNVLRVEPETSVLELCNFFCVLSPVLTIELNTFSINLPY